MFHDRIATGVSAKLRKMAEDDSTSARQFAEAILAEPVQPTPGYDEHQGRVYYQSIVYHVCNVIDSINGTKERIVCGTYYTPASCVEEWMDRLPGIMRHDRETTPGLIAAAERARDGMEALWHKMEQDCEAMTKARTNVNGLLF